MTIRTPEQIAEFTVVNDYQLEDETARGLDNPLLGWRETLEAALDARDGETPGDILSLIVSAIEADREQRERVHPDWQDDADNVRDCDGVTISWDAYVGRDSMIFTNAEITGAQAAAMLEAIGRLE